MNEMKKMTENEMEGIYRMACGAGQRAGDAAIPTPMLVGEPTTPLGNDIDYAKKTYYVADGVCGFAWVTIRPGTSRFARFLKKRGYARSDSYYGGVCVWARGYGQSMQRKEAWARAFAAELNKHGIEAMSMSRMD